MCADSCLKLHTVQVVGKAVIEKDLVAVFAPCSGWAESLRRMSELAFESPWGMAAVMQDHMMLTKMEKRLSKTRHLSISRGSTENVERKGV